MKKITSALLGVFFFCSPLVALAGDDPSIPKVEKQLIQKAMKTHIEVVSDKTNYPIYDASTKSLIRLQFDNLHSGVVRKGDLYVSCADFVGKDGSTYDIDFFTRKKGAGYTVVESLIHVRNGVKSKYDVMHD